MPTSTKKSVGGNEDIGSHGLYRDIFQLLRHVLHNPTAVVGLIAIIAVAGIVYIAIFGGKS